MMQVNTVTMKAFHDYLVEQECSSATVSKYMHDVGQLALFCDGQAEDKNVLIAFKAQMQARGYAPASVNSMLTAVNRFLEFAGHPDWKLRLLKLQRSTFTDGDRELTRRDYERLLMAAKRMGDERLEMLVQTIGSTGIRVSEVRAITVESARRKQAEIRCKGKIRTILMPKKLCQVLLAYCKRHKIRSGQIVVTRAGRPLDRSNIWKMMKRLAEKAGVALQKVFPHNLRHLFARTYYKAYKDIVRLADILGHASIDTTRIYTVRSSAEQQRQIERLPLLI